MICPVCLVDKHFYNKKWCRSCYEKHLKNINPEFLERQQESSKFWHRNNRERVTIYQKLRLTDPVLRERDRLTKRKRHFEQLGLTEEEYQKQRIAGCSICDNKKYLHIDHDHITGRFRGILCSRCNNGLGMLGDNIEGVTKTLEYLKRVNSS